MRGKSCCNERWKRRLGLDLPLGNHLVAFELFYFWLGPVGLQIELVVVVLKGEIERIRRIVGKELAEHFPDRHVDHIITRAPFVPI